MPTFRATSSPESGDLSGHPSMGPPPREDENPVASRHQRFGSLACGRGVRLRCPDPVGLRSRSDGVHRSPSSVRRKHRSAHRCSLSSMRARVQRAPSEHLPPEAHPGEPGALFGCGGVPAKPGTLPALGREAPAWRAVVSEGADFGAIIT